MLRFYKISSKNERKEVERREEERRVEAREGVRRR
jgi:hypothetical protein